MQNEGIKYYFVFSIHSEQNVGGKSYIIYIFNI